MTAATLALTEFLVARLAEDAIAANDALRHPFLDGKWEDVGPAWFCDELSEHVAMAPRRVLADCRAKRRIIDLCEPVAGLGGPLPALAFEVLLDLALPYTTHPDYRDFWEL